MYPELLVPWMVPLKKGPLDHLQQVTHGPNIVESSCWGPLEWSAG